MFYISTYLYIHRPMHVSGLLISLWDPANPPFVRDIYTTPTGYVQKGKHVNKIHLILLLQVTSFHSVVVFCGSNETYTNSTYLNRIHIRQRGIAVDFSPFLFYQCREQACPICREILFFN